MNKTEWIDSALLRQFEGEGTNAHRLCTIGHGWAERFGRDVLISFRNDAAHDRLAAELDNWTKSVDFTIKRVFARFLPKKNEERETPKLLSGNEGENLQTLVTENHLKFGIDFGEGYYVGPIVDPRVRR